MPPTYILLHIKRLDANGRTQNSSCQRDPVSCVTPSPENKRRSISETKRVDGEDVCFGRTMKICIRGRIATRRPPDGGERTREHKTTRTRWPPGEEGLRTFRLNVATVNIIAGGLGIKSKRFISIRRVEGSLPLLYFKNRVNC